MNQISVIVKNSVRPTSVFGVLAEFSCAIQVGNVTAFSTRVSCMICILLLITEFTEYVVVTLKLRKRIGQSEGVFMCYNVSGALKSSTFMVNQELANATQVGSVLTFLTTDLASELDLGQGANKCMLVTIIGINSPTRTTFNVEVIITEGTSVKEASTATIATSIAIISLRWRSENKGVL